MEYLLWVLIPLLAWSGVVSWRIDHVVDSLYVRVWPFAAMLAFHRLRATVGFKILHGQVDSLMTNLIKPYAGNRYHTARHWSVAGE